MPVSVGRQNARLLHAARQDVAVGIRMRQIGLLYPYFYAILGDSKIDECSRSVQNGRRKKKK